MTEHYQIAEAPSGVGIVAQNNYILISNGDGTWRTGPQSGGGGAVDSVFGRTGVVVAVSGDYTSAQVTNTSSVTGTNVTDALDALQTQIVSLGARITPIEVLESATTGFWDATFPADSVLKENGGDPIELTFTNWTAGDILRASFWVSARSFDVDEDLDFQLYAWVSLDGGETFQFLLPATCQLIAPSSILPSSPKPISGSGSASIACATKPIVRIGCTIFASTHVEISMGNGLGAMLRIERYQGGSYTTAGTLTDTAS